MRINLTLNNEVCYISDVLYLILFFFKLTYNNRCLKLRPISRLKLKKKNRISGLDDYET